MKKIAKSILLTLLMIGVATQGGTALAAASDNAAQQIIKYGSQGTFSGAAEFFTGEVKVDMLFPASKELSVGGAYVTFAAGARSAWHVHPLGQTLLVISGTAWTQEWGKAIQEAGAGDVIVCPAGIKHWHGATPSSAMTHLALTGTTVEGKNVTWLEHVSEAQYRGK